MSKLQQQIDLLANFGVDCQDADTVDRIQTVLGTAISARDQDQRSEPVDLPDDLAEEVRLYQNRQSLADFSRKATDELTEACRLAGAKEGAEGYFSERVVSVDGKPHVKLRDGRTAPISAAIVNGELPAGLLDNRVAKRQDEFGDLKELIDLQEKKLAEAKRLAHQNRAESQYLILAGQERAKLKELIERRDAILAEKEAERNPPAPPKAPTPMERGRLDSLRAKAAQAKQRLQADPRDNRLLAELSVARRQAEAYAREIGVA